MGHVFVQRRLASTGPVATCGYTYSSAEPWSQMLREEVQEVSHTGRQTILHTSLMHVSHTGLQMVWHSSWQCCSQIVWHAWPQCLWQWTSHTGLQTV